MNATANDVVELNRDIGYHLMNYLEGIDAANFLEAVNNSSQFRSIATTSDHVFQKLIGRIFRSRQRVILPRRAFECYLNECEVVDDKLVPLEEHYAPCIQPIQRVFVYACFSTEGFGLLCQAYRTSLFQCYSRLIPFNTDFYCADFGLLDYEIYIRTIGQKRNLNDHEKTYFQSKK